eukprot:1607855-Pyramimonas_sp.AAC.1
MAAARPWCSPPRGTSGAARTNCTAPAAPSCGRRRDPRDTARGQCSSQWPHRSAAPPLRTAWSAAEHSTAPGVGPLEHDHPSPPVAA